MSNEILNFGQHRTPEDTISFVRDIVANNDIMHCVNEFISLDGWVDYHLTVKDYVALNTARQGRLHFDLAAWDKWGDNWGIALASVQ